MSVEDGLKHWLASVQHSNLGARQIIDPQRSGQSTGEIIDDAGGGRRFDTEPARYTQLLHRLMPGAAKHD